MENILFAAPTSAVWLLSGIGLIVCNLFSRRLSAARYRAPGRFFQMFLAIVTFVFFFYSTTFAISLLYTLDFAFLTFFELMTLITRFFGLALNSCRFARWASLSTLDRAVTVRMMSITLTESDFLPVNYRTTVEYLMKTWKVVPIATALLLMFGRYAFSMSCKATSPTTQDCAVGLTWQDNSSGSNQEDFVDIYLSVGATAFSKVGTVASDVVAFVDNDAGVGAGFNSATKSRQRTMPGYRPFPASSVRRLRQ